jgi:sulfur carrier protein
MSRFIQLARYVHWIRLRTSGATLKPVPEEPLSIQLNGQLRTLADLASPTTLDHLIEALALKADRVAVEVNGEIAPRTIWPATHIATGDRLEIVHFVGGGCRS